MWLLTASDEDAPPFDQFLIEFRAAQCAHSLTDHHREELINLKKRQNGKADNIQLQLLREEEVSGCDKEIQRCIRFLPESSGFLLILLNAQLDFEVTSLILLDFAVRPNGSDLEAAFATLVIRVENVLETIQMHECQQPQRIHEQDSKAELACTMLIETDARPDTISCNLKASKWQYFVVVMNLSTSRIYNSKVTDRPDIQTARNAHDGISTSVRLESVRWRVSLEVWKADGVTVDYETEPTIHGAVECFMHEMPFASKYITVFVLDVNEPPVFPYTLYELTILEGPVTHQTRNKTELSMRAIDPDAAANLTYSLQSERDVDIENLFVIEADSGNLSAKMGVEFDRESREFYNFTVIVSDGEQPSLNATTRVSIRILDKNDNCPVWTDPSQSAIFDPPISEMPHGLQPPLLLYRFRAEDPDLGSGGVVQFILADKMMWNSDTGIERQLVAPEIISRIRIELNESSGEMRLLSKLDRSFIDHVLELTVEAHDSAPPFNAARKNASIRFRITSTGQHPELYFLLALLSCLCVLANLVLLFFIRRYWNRMRQPGSGDSNRISIDTERSSSNEPSSTSESESSDKGTSESASSDKGSSETAGSDKGTSATASYNMRNPENVSPDRASCARASSPNEISRKRFVNFDNKCSANENSERCCPEKKISPSSISVREVQMIQMEMNK